MAVSYETNPLSLLTAKKIVYNGRSVTLRVDLYGGYRMSRIRDRNGITNGLGFPHCGGDEFWSLDYDDGSGVFLADVLVDAAKGMDVLHVDGKQLWPQTGFHFDGGFMGYKEQPLPKTSDEANHGSR